MDNQKRVLLAVLAHPDDESFGMGGTLALYARQGVAVHLVCATRGEAGEVDEEYLEGFGSIAERRESELRCAAEMLGLADVHFLDYRDSGMTGSPANQHPQALAAAPLLEVAEKIACWIRELQPQVVVTFDPIGGYRHPDHIAIHQATVKAFTMAADPQIWAGGLAPFRTQKLYYHTIPRGLFRWGVRLLRLFGRDPRRWGRNGDIDLVALAADDFPVQARIDIRPVAGIKAQASACHASQGGPVMRQGLFGWVTRLGNRYENYMLADPPPVPGLIENDFFADISS
ncbi:MAG TPA: PIG-L family deacetylase [Anaerolineales bacterium]|nr:PIG-L family deacetylase [Anaerolineales bacterium]